MKFRLKKIVSRSSVWEIDAETPAEALCKVERGDGKQIGWENSETNVSILTQLMHEERELVEEEQPKQV